MGGFDAVIPPRHRPAALRFELIVHPLRPAAHSALQGAFIEHIHHTRRWVRGNDHGKDSAEKLKSLWPSSRVAPTDGTELDVFAVRTNEELEVRRPRVRLAR